MTSSPPSPKGHLSSEITASILSPSLSPREHQSSSSSTSSLVFSSSHERNLSILQDLIKYAEVLKEICLTYPTSSSSQSSSSSLTSTSQLQQEGHHHHHHQQQQQQQQQGQDLSVLPCPQLLPVLQSLESHLLDNANSSSEQLLIRETLTELRENIYRSTLPLRATAVRPTVAREWQGSLPPVPIRQSSEDELRGPLTTCETSEGEDDHFSLPLFSPNLFQIIHSTPPLPPLLLAPAPPLSSSSLSEDSAPSPPSPVRDPCEGQEDGLPDLQHPQQLHHHPHPSLSRLERCTSTPVSFDDEEGEDSISLLEGEGDGTGERSEDDHSDRGKRNKRLNKSATAQLTQWLLSHLGTLPLPPSLTSPPSHQTNPSPLKRRRSPLPQLFISLRSKWGIG
jgi:hypothetical protein